MKGYKYVYAPDHPNRNHKNQMAEHRLVMEQKMGRLLDRNEVVHHVNGDILDNRPENLEIFAKNSEHLRHELTGKVPNWSEDGWSKICSPKLSLRKPNSPNSRFYVPSSPRTDHQNESPSLAAPIHDVRDGSDDPPSMFEPDDLDGSTST